MIALLQRVSFARLRIAGEVHAQTGPGLLVLLGVEKKDTRDLADRLINRILNYRVFTDAVGKMNLSLADTGGDLMLVSQFTLAADTGSGLRPSFSSACPPQEAAALYDYAVGRATALHGKVRSGVFGADMKIALENDGPVTFLLRV